MFRWVPYPFLRITPLLMLGIGIATQVSPKLAIGIFFVVFLIYSAFRFLLSKPFFSRYHFWMGSVAALSIVMLGILRTHQHNSASSSDHILHLTDTADYYIATVASHPEAKKNSYQVLLDIEHVYSKKAEKLRSKTGKILVYQPKAADSQLMQFGDRVLIKGLPYVVDPPKNPSEFDYRQYLAYQNIYHQQYVSSSNWKLLEKNAIPAWFGVSEAWRHQCRDKLLQYVKGPQVQGIALAITLGLKSHLDQELQKAYAATGAMHILAVSGLHVGIIYLILNFLFCKLKQLSRLGVAMYITACLSGLWAYALLAGLSPSVQRAAVMFSFILIGSTFRQQSNIYNTLACSAFVLLWINPFILYSVGFQLSYLAVFGIVYLQPRIYAWFEFSTKIAGWVWQLTSVSIAAQIATFPLGIYYFHQFPIYFWISNIVVIPGALIMLPMGLATLGTGFFIPSLAKVFGWLLEMIIRLVNASVSFIQQLPGSTIEHISITTAQTWLIYATVFSLILLFHYRKLRYFTLSVLFLFIVVTIQTIRLYQQHREMSMTVYNVKENTHIDFTHGFTNLHIGPWTARAQYHILPNHIQKGLQTEFVTDSTEQAKLIRATNQRIEMVRWQGKTIAIIREPLHLAIPQQPFTVDYAIITHNAIRKLSQLNNIFSYSQLIIDGTNNRFTAQKLANEAVREHIAFHSVPVQGAITIPWKP